MPGQATQLSALPNRHNDMAHAAASTICSLRDIAPFLNMGAATEAKVLQHPLGSSGSSDRLRVAAVAHPKPSAAAVQVANLWLLNDRMVTSGEGLETMRTSRGHDQVLNIQNWTLKRVGIILFSVGGKLGGARAHFPLLIARREAELIIEKSTPRRVSRSGPPARLHKPQRIAEAAALVTTITRTSVFLLLLLFPVAQAVYPSPLQCSASKCTTLGWGTGQGSTAVSAASSSTPLPGCSGYVDFQTAVNFCEDVGAR